MLNAILLRKMKTKLFRKLAIVLLNNLKIQISLFKIKTNLQNKKLEVKKIVQK